MKNPGVSPASERPKKARLAFMPPESWLIWVWLALSASTPKSAKCFSTPGYGSKLGTPKLWMVNTKLDIHICGPLGLPFWPTSTWGKIGRKPCEKYGCIHHNSCKMLEKYGYPITSPSKNVSYMGLQHISQFHKEAYWICHNWPIFPIGKAPGERKQSLTWLCQLLGHQPSHGRLTLILTLHQLQVTHLHQGVLAFWWIPGNLLWLIPFRRGSTWFACDKNIHII